MRRIGRLTPVSFALAQAACLWLWLSVIGRGLAGDARGPLLGLPAILLFGHALAAAAVPLAVLRGRLPPARRVLAQDAVALAAIGLTVLLAAQRLGGDLSRQGPGALVFTGVMLGVVWWRGAVLAADEFVHGAVLAEWRAYTVVVVLLLLLGVPAGSLGAGTGPALALFLVGGLVALAASWRQRVMAGTRRGRVEGPWLATLVLVVPAVFLPSLVAAVLLGPRVMAGLLHAVGTLRDVILWLLTPLLWVIAWAVAAVIELLRAGAHARPRQPLLPVASHLPPRTQPALHTLPLSPWVSAAGLALLILCLLVLYLLAMRRLASRRHSVVLAPAAVEEQREALVSWQQVWRAVLAWLRRLGRGTATVPAVPAVVSEVREVQAPTTLTIRELYRRLLVLGAAHGAVRGPTETPYEYLVHLRQGLAEREKEVSLLTAAYVQARYGGEAATQRQVEQARAAGRRLGIAEAAVQGDPADAATEG